MVDEPITELLRAAGAGDGPALRRVYELSYDELRRLARVVRRGSPAATLNTRPRCS